MAALPDDARARDSSTDVESVRRIPTGGGEIVVRTRRVVLSGEQARLEAGRLRETLERSGEEALLSAARLREGLDRNARPPRRGNLLLGVFLALVLAIAGFALAGGGGFVVGLLVGSFVLAASLARGVIHFDPVQIKLSVVTHRTRGPRGGGAGDETARRSI